MGTVLVSIGKDDDFAVFEVVQGKAFINAGPQGSNEAAEFLIGEDLIQMLLFNVQGFAAEGKDSLETTIPALLGAAACGITFHDEELVILPVASGAAGELADQRSGLQLAGFTDVVTGFAGSFPGLGGTHRLGDDGVGNFLVFQVVQPVQQLLGNDGFHSGAHFTVAEAALGLAFKLGILDHGGQDTGEAFAEIFTCQVVILFLQQADAAGIIVEALCKGGFKTGLVGAALRCVDVVDIREEAFGVAVGILDGSTADDRVTLAFNIDDIFLQGVFAGIQITDIIGNASVIAEDTGAAVRIGNPLIREGDADAAVQVRQLLQAAGDSFSMEADVLENLVVRKETNQGALFTGVAENFQRTFGLAGVDFAGGGIHSAGEGHTVMGPVEEDVDGEPLAQGVDDAGADAVETAGIVIVLTVELAAGMKHGEDDFNAGLVHGRVVVHGHAAPVVIDAGGAVLVQGDGHFGSEAVGRFVDGVVHDLPQEMVKAAGRSSTDIHAGAHTHSLQAFQHLDITGIIGLGCHGFTPLGLSTKGPNDDSILYHKMCLKRKGNTRFCKLYSLQNQ